MNRATAPLKTSADWLEQHRRDRERIDALELEVDDLREQLRQLEVGMAAEWMPPLEMQLTALEARVLIALMGREGVLTKQAIMSLIYADRIGDPPMVKIVDVFVCKLRKKILPFGFTIETVWGRGYSVTAETRARLNALDGPELIGARA